MTDQSIPPDREVENWKLFYLRARIVELVKDEGFDYFAVFQFSVWGYPQVSLLFSHSVW